MPPPCRARGGAANAWAKRRPARWRAFLVFPDEPQRGCLSTQTLSSLGLEATGLGKFVVLKATRIRGYAAFALKSKPPLVMLDR